MLYPPLFLFKKVIIYCVKFVYNELFFNGNCRSHDVYQCGDLGKFVETVTEKVESLPAKKIADILNGFLEQYELF